MPPALLLVVATSRAVRGWCCELPRAAPVATPLAAGGRVGAVAAPDGGGWGCPTRCLLAADGALVGVAAVFMVARAHGGPKPTWRAVSVHAACPGMSAPEYCEAAALHSTVQFCAVFAIDGHTLTPPVASCDGRRHQYLNGLSHGLRQPKLTAKRQLARFREGCSLRIGRGRGRCIMSIGCRSHGCVMSFGCWRLHLQQPKLMAAWWMGSWILAAPRVYSRDASAKKGLVTS